MVVRRPYCTDLWKSLFWVSELNTRAHTCTNAHKLNSQVPHGSYKAHCCESGISDERRNKEMPQNLNAPVVALLQLSKCLMCASTDKAAHSLPNSFDFFFFFISLFQWWTVKRLCFLLYASKLHKDVFDLRNQICVSSIVSISDCGNLKVRSERPFDNYRKTFWLYYTAFHLLSGRG